ncbi:MULTISPECIES: low molecular weight phosphatase family protein [Dehalococcoides]|jgi:arsenate reductase|uniref:Arsenate reductase n=2 Tax=Dehalococcoides mccartyi TaxID=61435 RepID=A0A142V846_9CHLR|nr:MULTISPECIES: phosphatase [Dehalococcoides]AGG05799.1 protein-tyrosine-phosphatase family protein [Dehalococcoides mccartyi DCMB5]AGG07213.1 protein-tyrosine-phosphatase family protein [Dehalococcoides mccartyi BTF08]AII60364.1 arsenate reductase [Dehalococcoides mccartyi CG5]AMU85938.1 arsenate reductase [Dehalococcoides mccartyi]AQU05276.1 phosphatase [Dehalococcoides mccartyi]
MENRLQVLFVCLHNAGRSQAAEAIFNNLSGGRVVAISAGTEPSSALNPEVVAVLKEDGINTDGLKPKLLSQDMLDKASRIISMGCDVTLSCPGHLYGQEDWGITDPRGKNLAEVRLIVGGIRQKVENLLAELEKSEG